LTSQELPPEFVLFGEDASRVVLSCDPANVPRIQQVAGKYGFSAQLIGETISEQIEIQLNSRPVISASLGELRALYENALEKALRTELKSVAAD
jgi:phosphoribosylformylglycinamidine (FGAM) synthase-like enzyme